MKSSFLTLALVSAVILGCASQSAPVRQPTTSLLIGTDSSTARVLIKSVDNGPTLWASPGALATKASIKPGRHKIDVVCESQGSLHFAPGDVTIDVEPGHTYELVGALAAGASRCNVSASIRS
jgi:hypothetical protein